MGLNVLNTVFQNTYMEQKALVYAIVILLSGILLLSSHINTIHDSHYLALSNSNGSNTTYIAVNISQELNNSVNAGYNFTPNDFRSASSAQCLLVLISPCDNNNPSQFVCINSAYNEIYAQQHANLSRNGGACPDYELAGSVSCTSSSNYCEVTRSAFGSPISNQSNSTINPGGPCIGTNGQLCGNSTTINTSINTNTVDSAVSSFGNIINEIIQFVSGLIKKL
jgi:hypothetical protein